MPREPCREDLRHAVTPFPHCAADNVPASIADLRNVAVSVSVGKNTAETARAQMEKYAKFCTSPINLALTLLAPTFGARLAPEQRPWKFHCIVDSAVENLGRLCSRANNGVSFRDIKESWISTLDLR